MTVTQTKPIDLYFWPTPNGKKITILFEELGLPYELKFINIGKGDQFKPEFLEISPNNKMPAIVDPEGPDGAPISVFESGAILLYIGRKFGQFYPTAERERVAVEEWLMWQMAGFGPMLGQRNHFSVYAPERIPYATKRYQDETHRLYGVLDRRLANHEFVAGAYSIADMAIFGWAAGWETQQFDTSEFPHVKRWIDAMNARPGVQRGMAVKAPVAPLSLADDKEAQKILFNQRAR
ncbi:glutathione S-transferase N-terminal domain-containing protein [Kaistia dalseonensis]|uniref:GST-like protein n=1 Tax=Kaistia dalseonensis TaxID=410840 RepID=A0ABU0H3C1_9HYPH|nr:glutathione S-transferase N-terminal domain-containing protein [Kaistia dalseonensis]MCX5494215.1 glutathione S-transferase N-terminal domain-containing protein [Kaistia dalseonensis]MDQ0436794.1 GST-like protein [Kaistia dalseonensis]